MFLHLDCRHYLGDRPCRFKRLCEGCDHYEPMGPRVLIVKLGALGDVVRTASLLPGLPRMFGGEAPFVTWLTAPAALPLVERMRGVHRALPYGEESLFRLRAERFDLVLGLDKEPGPAAVASMVAAADRKGVGLSRYGTPYPLNAEAEYYFRLGLDDDEKFHRNEKSHPHLLYEAIGLDYEGERYELELRPEDVAGAARVFEGWRADVPSAGPILGLNPGAGGVFAKKNWPEASYVALMRRVAAARPGTRFLLLGGASEAPILARILASVPDLDARSAGTDHPLGTFTAIVDRCDAVVCGDTLAMHLAVARGRGVLAMFGPTCASEIDLFGLGEKLVTPIECSPCYLRRCEKSPDCQDLIGVDRVLEATLRVLDARSPRILPPRVPA